jgi:hypothetical protein
MGQLLNDIISTSVGGAAGGAVAGLVLYGVQQLHVKIKDGHDTKRVMSWMRENAGKDSRMPYRTTRAIASHTNLTMDRVRYLCSHCPEIHMSRGVSEDLWTLNKDLEDFRESMGQMKT